MPELCEAACDRGLVDRDWSPCGSRSADRGRDLASTHEGNVFGREYQTVLPDRRDLLCRRHRHRVLHHKDASHAKIISPPNFAACSVSEADKNFCRKENQKFDQRKSLSENPYESPQTSHSSILNRQTSWVLRLGALRWSILLSYVGMWAWFGLAQHVMRQIYGVPPTWTLPEGLEYMYLAMLMTLIWGTPIGLLAFVINNKWVATPYFIIVAIYFLIYLKNV